MHRSFAALVAVLLALGSAGCEYFGEPEAVGRTDEGALALGRVEATTTVTRVVAPSGRTLVLDGFRGSVRLEATDEPTARLVFTKRGRGSDAEAARAVADGIMVAEEGTDDAYTFTLEADEADRSAVDVRGLVPAGVAVRIDWKSGPVLLSGLEGPITVESQSGDVRVGGAAQGVQVSLRNGDVLAGFARLPADATVRLKTLNGDVTLVVPSAARAAIHAETQAGPIRVPEDGAGGFSFAKQDLAVSGAGATFEATLGDGGASVDLVTENGAVTLRPGTMRRLPDVAPDASRAPLPPPDTTYADTVEADTSAPMPPDTSAADTSARPERPLPIDTTGDARTAPTDASAEADTARPGVPLPPPADSIRR
jgi:hypothetical protein